MGAGSCAAGAAGGRPEAPEPREARTRAAAGGGTGGGAAPRLCPRPPGAAQQLLFGSPGGARARSHPGTRVPGARAPSIFFPSLSFSHSKVGHRVEVTAGTDPGFDAKADFLPRPRAGGEALQLFGSVELPAPIPCSQRRRPWR